MHKILRPSELVAGQVVLGVQWVVSGDGKLEAFWLIAESVVDAAVDILSVQPVSRSCK